MAVPDLQWPAEMLANLHSTKDHMTLLKAWKIVIDQLSASFPVELILAGKEGDTTVALKAFTDEHKLRTVSFAGQLSNVYGLLATCSIGVFSSLKEGLPNGILECMAMKLPVVATRIHGSLEALGNDCNFLVAPSNPEDLAKKLLQLILDSDLREMEGLKNQKRIHELFCMEKMIGQYDTLVKSV